MSIFSSSFKRSKTFTVNNINFDTVENKGTAHLTAGYHHYILVWSIRTYPMEMPGAPGSPYPIIFSYTIFDKNNYYDEKSHRSIRGEFIFEVNSGTLPNNSALGIPYGVYTSLARNNNYHRRDIHTEFILSENSSTIIFS